MTRRRWQPPKGWTRYADGVLAGPEGRRVYRTPTKRYAAEGPSGSFCALTGGRKNVGVYDTPDLAIAAAEEAPGG